MKTQVKLLGSVLWGLAVFGCTVPWASAEDPSRFLAVTNWHAAFTRTLQSSGTYTEGSCIYKWSFSHSGQISSQLQYLPEATWTDAGSTNVSVTISIQDSGSQTCGDSTITYQASAGNPMQVLQGCGLVIDVASTNYAFSPGYLLFPVKGTVDGSAYPDTGLMWAPPFQLFLNPILEPLPASGMVLQGSRRYPLNTLDYQDSGVFTVAASGSPLGATGTTEGLNGELVLTWTLTPSVEEVEVVIESDQYEDWLPTGDLKDWNKHGEDILFVIARLRLKDGTEDQVPQSRAKWFKFELLEVSSEPGVCMNRPSKQSANTRSDLRFESSVNGPPLIVPALAIQDGGLTAKTPNDDEGYAGVVAGISSFDFGAYGKLKVTAEVNGREIVGYWKNDPAREQKPLLLPKRQPDSKIADKWKEDNNAGGLADDDDSENDPVGDGHQGDGLTLYEEYRGFSENLRHTVGNPRKKDFFVCDRIGNGISTAGISLFAAQSRLRVISKLRPEEFNVSAGLNFDTQINFNHSQNAPHGVDQHGVLLLRGAADADESFSEGSYGGTPGASGPIFMGPYISRNSGWQTIDLAGGGRVITFLGASSVAHELAHTCAVWHHGDSDDKVTWRKVTRFENGVARDVLQENGQDITLLYESGQPAPLGIGSNLTIGVPQGQHSGNGDCIMRYFSAVAYRSQSDFRVRYKVEEVKGINLCTSATGTGVNAAGRSPQPRYGDAAPNRGNCKGQICVNDRYMDSAEHQR